MCLVRRRRFPLGNEAAEFHKGGVFAQNARVRRSRFRPKHWHRRGRGRTHRVYMSTATQTMPDGCRCRQLQEEETAMKEVLRMTSKISELSLSSENQIAMNETAQTFSWIDIAKQLTELFLEMQITGEEGTENSMYRIQTE